MFSCHPSFGFCFRAMVVALVFGLTSCASRPTSAVLDPITIDRGPAQQAAVLTVTNRNRAADGGFGSNWAAGLTYERYEISVPPDRRGSAISYPDKTPDARRQYIVTRRENLSSSAFADEVNRSASADGTVIVFVHGYNFSYQEALFRIAQMSADARPPGPPILFSWPSAASVTGYVTDRDAVLYSRSELDSLLAALSKSGRVKRIVLFGHSMGGFLSMEAIRQLKLQGRTDVLAKMEVVLAAPDIDVDVFRSQLHDIGRMPRPITLLVSKTDRALAISSVIGGERPRVGRLDINDPFIENVAKLEHLQIIDITSLQSSDGLGHDRYAVFAKFGGQLAQAEARQRQGNIGAFVFDAAGAIVARPFRLAGELSRKAADQGFSTAQQSLEKLQMQE